MTAPWSTMPVTGAQHAAWMAEAGFSDRAVLMDRILDLLKLGWAGPLSADMKHEFGDLLRMLTKEEHIELVDRARRLAREP